MSTFYRVLGVTSQADDAEIKLAFRRLAKAFHPDVNPGNRVLGEVPEVLSVQEKLPLSLGVSD
jgi:curved DNA-binding protein CbpA